MNQAMPNIAFHGMSAFFVLRDMVRPRSILLNEVGLIAGQTVLDFGCGPGGYIPEVARQIGAQGRIIALDIHPLALRRVQRIAERLGLANVETIHSDGPTDLPDGSVDVVLLHDVYHMLADPRAVLTEMRRVLGARGVLSVNEPHMPRQDVIAGITADGLFRLVTQGRHTLSFVRE